MKSSLLPFIVVIICVFGVMALSTCNSKSSEWEHLFPNESWNVFPEKEMQTFKGVLTFIDNQKKKEKEEEFGFLQCKSI